MATKKIVEENENAVVEKEAVNVLDLLLGADIGTIKTPYKDVEITRLSEAFGAPFVVRCEALSPETRMQMYSDIYDDAAWLHNLVENLLAVTRIEEGHMKLNTQPQL
ncbi:MAG: hypothetical protein ACI4EN_04275, partial [Butyrivibrio sp.]